MDELNKSEQQVLDRLRQMQGLGDRQLAALLDGVGPKGAILIDRLVAALRISREESRSAEDDCARLRAYIDALHGKGAVRHCYAGLCPDESQPDSRDSECPACRLAPG